MNIKCGNKYTWQKNSKILFSLPYLAQFTGNDIDYKWNDEWKVVQCILYDWVTKYKGFYDNIL